MAKTKGISKKKHPKKRKRFVTKTVEINPDCTTVPDELYLDYTKGDQAKWHSNGGSFAIVFYPDPPTYPDTSPFRRTIFVVDDHGVTPSGPIVKNFKGDYKYRVVGDDGCCKDPVIHIGP